MSFRMFLVMFMILLSGISCRDNGINWERVDPQLKQELERANPAPDTHIDGIIHTKARLTEEQRSELEGEGIMVRTITATMVTAQFPVKCLPLLTTRSYIIFISGPSEHSPFPASP